MNRQTFQEYLQEPSKLYQLSLTELQGLVLDYPYSANLRLLLLIKTRLENHPSAEQIVSQVAARTFDRGHLYDLLRRLDNEAELDGDTLELLELDETKEPIILEQPISDKAASTSSTSEVSTGPFSEASSEAQSSEASSEVSSSEVSGFASSEAGFASFTLPRSSLKANASTRRLGGESSRGESSTRLIRLKKRQLARIQSRLEGKDESAELKLRRIARRSVSRHKGVASETLANLLVGQGQYQRAIRMYEELSLAHPEKKANFAGHIKELKEKL
ncbi:MAG: hypothetical protein AAGF87_05295 [Bacteroidota bacterium]